MNRLFSYLALAILSTLLCVGCSKDADIAQSPNKPGPPAEPEAKSYIRFNQGSFSLGSLTGDETEVEFESNRDIFEVYTVPEITWAEVKIKDKKLIATAKTNNLVFETNTAIVHVKAGSGDDIKTAQIVLLQMPVIEPDATLTLTPDAVSLDGAANLTKTVAITSNKVNFTAAVDALSIGWLSATISGTTITLKTLTANATEGDRNAIVTVTATGVDKTISKDIAVTQKRVSLPSGMQVGAIYQGGMIYSIENYTLGDTLKVVSLKEPPATLPWATDVSYLVSGLVDASKNGVLNNKLIREDARYPEGFPAAAYCGAMGNEWYLPTRYEITDIKNSGINAYMGQQPNSEPFISSYYWSSSPHGTKPENVNAVNPISGASGNYAKTGVRSVRCIKKVFVPTT